MILRLFSIGFLLVVSTSCRLDENVYGGTTEPAVINVPTELDPAPVLASPFMFLRIENKDYVESNGAITKITNQIGTYLNQTGIDLNPSAYATGSISDSWMKLGASQGGEYFETPSDKYLEMSSFAMIALLKTSSRGDVISFNPWDRKNQSLEVAISDTDIRVRFYFSPSDYLEQIVGLPTRDEILLSATLDNSTNELKVSVNGVIAPEATVTGSASGILDMSRILQLGSSDHSEDLQIKTLYMFSRSLSLLETAALLGFVLKQNNIAGMTLDAGFGVPAGGGTSGPDLFAPVKTIIASQCAGCHGTWVGQNANYFKSLGLVSPKNPEGSKLYYRLQGSTGGNGPKTMPSSGASLSAAQLDSVKAWVNSL